MERKLLIYDVDKTILDSSYPLYYWWLEIAKEFNTTFFESKEHYDYIIKKYDSKWMDFAIEEFWLHKNHHKKIIKIWKRNIKRLYDEHAKPYEWYKEIFDKLREQY